MRPCGCPRTCWHQPVPPRPSVWTEIVVRPGGRPYRARMRPRAELINEHDDAQVIVWRTHDLDVAVALAAHCWEYDWGWGGPLPPARIGWWRTLPWGDGDYTHTIIECSPANRAAVPAVMFV